MDSLTNWILAFFVLSKMQERKERKIAKRKTLEIGPKKPIFETHSKLKVFLISIAVLILFFIINITKIMK